LKIHLKLNNFVFLLDFYKSFIIIRSMETNRIVSIIISDLSLENLKLQESLEKAINSSDDVNTKLTKVKMYLAELATNEMMITKFQSLVSPQNNNDLKMNQNG